MKMIRFASGLAVSTGIFLLAPLVALAAVPQVASVTPPSGSASGVFMEFTVAFDQPVNGVDARDLLVNGSPAAAVNGSGAVYTFSFAQPNPGSVQVKFAPDSAITALDSVADLFDPASGEWTYTLRDISPPTVLAIHPP